MNWPMIASIDKCSVGAGRRWATHGLVDVLLWASRQLRLDALQHAQQVAGGQQLVRQQRVQRVEQRQHDAVVLGVPAEHLHQHVTVSGGRAWTDCLGDRGGGVE